jgi:hypothetical protein
MAYPRPLVGTHRTAAATPAPPSAGLPQPPGRRPQGHGRHLLRAPHRLQWGALDATGICKHPSAHRRFQEWAAAGVFVNLWAQGLEEYDEIKGLDWEWLAMDGAMTKAPWEASGPAGIRRIGASGAPSGAC